jgi:hypothetical protein
MTRKGEAAMGVVKKLFPIATRSKTNVRESAKPYGRPESQKKEVSKDPHQPLMDLKSKTTAAEKKKAQEELKRNIMPVLPKPKNFKPVVPKNVKIEEPVKMPSTLKEEAKEAARKDKDVTDKKVKKDNPGVVNLVNAALNSEVVVKMQDLIKVPEFRRVITKKTSIKKSGDDDEDLMEINGYELVDNDDENFEEGQGTGYDLKSSKLFRNDVGDTVVHVTRSSETEDLIAHIEGYSEPV